MSPEKLSKPLDRREFLGVGGAIVGGLGTVGGAALFAADFKVVWDLDKAYRETTATRGTRQDQDGRKVEVSQPLHS